MTIFIIMFICCILEVLSSPTPSQVAQLLFGKGSIDIGVNGTSPLGVVLLGCYRFSVDSGSQPLISIGSSSHHLPLNGLPKPTHRRSSAPVTRTSKPLWVSGAWRLCVVVLRVFNHLVVDAIQWIKTETTLINTSNKQKEIIITPKHQLRNSPKQRRTWTIILRFIRLWNNHLTSSLPKIQRFLNKSHTLYIYIVTCLLLLFVLICVHGF
jgi:hypothetical protein